MDTIDKVGRRPFNLEVSILIEILELKVDLNLITPQPKSQIAERPNRIFEQLLMKFFKKNDIPTTPIVIRTASESAQNKAT